MIGTLSQLSKKRNPYAFESLDEDDYSSGDENIGKNHMSDSSSSIVHNEIGKEEKEKGYPHKPNHLGNELPKTIESDAWESADETTTDDELTKKTIVEKIEDDFVKYRSKNMKEFKAEPNSGNHMKIDLDKIPDISTLFNKNKNVGCVTYPPDYHHHHHHHHHHKEDENSEKEERVKSKFGEKINLDDIPDISTLINDKRTLFSKKTETIGHGDYYKKKHNNHSHHHNHHNHHKKDDEDEDEDEYYDRSYDNNHHVRVTPYDIERIEPFESKINNTIRVEDLPDLSVLLKNNSKRDYKEKNVKPVNERKWEKSFIDESDEEKDNEKYFYIKNDLLDYKGKKNFPKIQLMKKKTEVKKQTKENAEWLKSVDDESKKPYDSNIKLTEERNKIADSFCKTNFESMNAKDKSKFHSQMKELMECYSKMEEADDDKLDLIEFGKTNVILKSIKDFEEDKNLLSKYFEISRNIGMDCE